MLLLRIFWFPESSDLLFGALWLGLVCLLVTKCWLHVFVECFFFPSILVILTFLKNNYLIVVLEIDYYYISVQIVTGNEMKHVWN